MANTFYVPDYCLSPKELEKQFLLWANRSLYGLLENTEEAHVYYPHHLVSQNVTVKPTSKQLEKINELYRLGFHVYKVISCPFDLFVLTITGKKGIHERNKHISARDGNGLYFRQGHKYLKSTKHQRKELTDKELQNKEWRKNKGFEKDYRNRNKGSNGSRKTFCKRQSNRCHRAWQEKLIKNEEWDKITRLKNKLYFDPWDWDD